MFDEAQHSLEWNGQADPRHAVSVTRVVALGVGDAGLSALKRFFIALNQGAGICFVIVQHGTLTQPCVTPELLGQFTELSVSDLRSGDRLAPDHIFVAPPDLAVDFDFSAAQLQVNKLIEPSERRTIIDRLFRSLAHGFGPRAVGVILPGSGRDGSLGVQAISRAGGMTIAVEPTPETTADGSEPNDPNEGARDPSFGMPDSAVATGGVSHGISAFQAAQAVREGLEYVAPTREQLAISAREAMERENAELMRLNAQLFEIHGRFQATLAELRKQVAETTSRNDELTKERAELTGLIAGTSLALLFLDERFVVQGFSGDITQLYAITPADIGRPLGLVEHHAHEMPALPELDVLLQQHAEEVDIVTSDRWYLRRVLIRQPSAAAPLGIILVFIDVTRLKQSEAAALPDEEWVRTVTDASPSVISYVDEAIQRFLT